MAENPYAMTEKPPIPSIATGGREMHEVQAAITAANALPRNIGQAAEAVLQACRLPELADEGLYTYQRQGKTTQGLSIRIAEEIAKEWGNIDYGYRELARYPDMTLVESYAIDLQTNAKRTARMYIAHRRDVGGTTVPITSERAISEHVANYAARKVRGCVLSLIPYELKQAILKQCQETCAAYATKDKVTALVAAFQGLGVSQAMLETFLGHRIQAADAVALRPIYRAIHEGEAGIEDYFAEESVLDTDEPKTEWPKEYNNQWYNRHGIRWESEIHASTRKCSRDGHWRRRRGVEHALVVAHEQALLAELSADAKAALFGTEAPPEQKAEQSDDQEEPGNGDRQRQEAHDEGDPDEAASDRRPTPEDVARVEREAVGGIR